MPAKTAAEIKKKGLKKTKFNGKQSKLIIANSSKIVSHLDNMPDTLCARNPGSKPNSFNKRTIVKISWS